MKEFREVILSFVQNETNRIKSYLFFKQAERRLSQASDERARNPLITVLLHAVITKWGEQRKKSHVACDALKDLEPIRNQVETLAGFRACPIVDVNFQENVMWNDCFVIKN